MLHDCGTEMSAQRAFGLQVSSVMFGLCWMGGLVDGIDCIMGMASWDGNERQRTNERMNNSKVS
jgi:hypothetical protein